MRIKPSLLFFLFVYLLISPRVFSQDVHFSQFYASPLTLNPAETGNFVGDCRLANNYRQQWKELGIPYRTLSLSYERQLFLKDQHFSAGIILVHDKSGDAKLTGNKMYLSAGYHKRVWGHTIHMGLQAGYIMKSFSIDALSFPNQWDNSLGQFNSSDPSLPNNENAQGIGPSLSYFDLNAGIGWTKRFNKFQPEVGAAFFHINHPRETFFSTGNRLKHRTTYYICGRFDVSNRIYLRPTLLFMSTVNAQDAVLGGLAGYNVGENKYKIKSLFVGGLFRDGIKRNMDAGIATMGVQFNRVDVGLSYDINISSLEVYTNNKGALEFSIIYRCKSSVPSKLAIPCDRL
ncbi:MAG: PorP/SprF family type IX secretion system membrane protein [Flavobacteriales bacterium]|nr:PorP/SprF family type IX secretion system membrane protein [Flavobacteriales bacterium]